MGFQHPDQDYREDLAAEKAWREEQEAAELELLAPLRCAPSELEGIGPKTRQVIYAERSHGAVNVALEPLFAGFRRRREEAIARTLRRTP